MKWVLQENGLRDDELLKFIRELSNMNEDYQLVKVVPFSHTMKPEIEEKEEETIIPFGTIFLCKIGEQRGWRVYHNNNFDQRVWTEKYSGYVLNEDAEYYKMKDVPEDIEGEVFVRPVFDWKLFTGHRRKGKKIRGWKTGYAGDGWDSDMVWEDALEQMVSVSSCKSIIDEIRFAVVDGRVITGSYYRINKRLKYVQVKDESLYEWAQGVVDLWKPLDNFVIDVAVTPDRERKVIEINTINACGLYDMDVGKMVEAIKIYEREK